jgi:hypothetical protein
MGSLLYLTHTRPDLSYAVGAVSRYMQEPHELHCKATKHILRYVQGTTCYGIHYATSCALISWASLILNGLDNTNRKSTSGYVVSLGFGPICWSSKKQPAISLSLVEVEYKGAVNVTI